MAIKIHEKVFQAKDIQTMDNKEEGEEEEEEEESGARKEEEKEENMIKSLAFIMTFRQKVLDGLPNCVLDQLPYLKRKTQLGMEWERKIFLQRERERFR